MTQAEFVSVVTFFPTTDELRSTSMRAAADRDRQLNDYGRMGFELRSTVKVLCGPDVQVIDTMQRLVEREPRYAS